MTKTLIAPFDTNLDLRIEKEIPAPANLIWRALVEPELVKKWFCPKPWQTVDCRVDLRAGGEFYTVMQSPEGEQFPGAGCFLEVVNEKRLVWSSALEAGFRPSSPATESDKECMDIIFTCIITLEELKGGTKYTATVLHNSHEQMKKHEEMGFHEGWGACLNQLADVVKSIK